MCVCICSRVWSLNSLPCTSTPSLLLSFTFHRSHHSLPLLPSLFHFTHICRNSLKAPPPLRHVSWLFLLELFIYPFTFSSIYQIFLVLLDKVPSSISNLTLSPLTTHKKIFYFAICMIFKNKSNASLTNADLIYLILTLFVCGMHILWIVHTWQVYS